MGDIFEMVCKACNHDYGMSLASFGVKTYGDQTQVVVTCPNCDATMTLQTEPQRRFETIKHCTAYPDGRCGCKDNSDCDSFDICSVVRRETE